MKPILVLALVWILGACAPEQGASTDTDLVSLPAEVLTRRIASGELSAVSVSAAFLERIDRLNARGPALRAVLELNDHALEDAAVLDELLARSGPLGSLHGLPVLIKGNIDVAGLVNAAGSLVLAEHRPEQDAHLVNTLRSAGAVILGTANLSEWANFRDGNSTSGWSGLGGQVKNPYVLDRNPCGSSSGSAAAVAAALAPVAVGTETHGSIVCPAAINGVVGIKPTVGLVSRTGIIPISHTQDTAGPLARTVTGAAMLLQAMIDFDSADPGAREGADQTLLPDPQFTNLNGRRIGVLRSYRGKGQRPRIEAIYQQSVERLKVLGAELVDPIEYEPVPAMYGASYRIMLREFKAGLNGYLASHSPGESRNSLADLIAFNRVNADRAMPIFDQSIFLEAEAMTGLDDPEYQADVTLAQVSLRQDVQHLFASHQLDALFLPVNGPAWKTDWVNGDQSNFGGTAYLAALTGFPSIVMPAGSVDGLPIAVGFTGLPLREAALIQMAYALEQALPPRPEPEFVPSVEEF